jgi:peptidyl-tRNA hydrolase
MRMYILIKDNIEPGFAITAAAHGALACYLKFKDEPNMAKWLDQSFKKVVCRVGATEFESAKAFADHVVMTESALGETAIVFKPREEWPKPFRFYRLWR